MQKGSSSGNPWMKWTPNEERAMNVMATHVMDLCLTYGY